MSYQATWEEPYGFYARFTGWVTPESAARLVRELGADERLALRALAVAARLGAVARIAVVAVAVARAVSRRGRGHLPVLFLAGTGVAGVGRGRCVRDHCVSSLASVRVPEAALDQPLLDRAANRDAGRKGMRHEGEVVRRRYDPFMGPGFAGVRG